MTKLIWEQDWVLEDFQAKVQIRIQTTKGKQT